MSVAIQPVREVSFAPISKLILLLL